MQKPEETLDPADWEQLRLLAHTMIDDMVDYLSGVKNRPIWQKTPDSVKSFLNTDLPIHPTPIEEIYEDFKTYILPYNKGNVTPRFWSWVEGGGTPIGALADMWAATMNPNVTIGDHAAMYVDAQVVNWCKQMMGFPNDSSGILVSGGSIANITALIVARNSFQNGILKEKGLKSIDNQLIMYCSDETHNCVVKAAQVIGIGEENLRKVPVNEQYEIRTDLLREMIETDTKAGNLPFCIVGNAGTVNTGAIDDLDELVNISKEYKLWLHVDGAFGAMPKLLPEFEPQLKAIEQADSVSFDLHKWMYVNYEIACLLVRDAKLHRAAYSPNSSINYLLRHERGLSAGLDSVQNYGMELSRGFKALKAWMSLREHGIEKYRRLIRQNIEQCKYLGELIENDPNLELVVPISMNLVCFRFIHNSLIDSELNELNKEILMQLHEQGIALPSYTVLNGKYVIRVANTNHRSTRFDFEVLAKEVVRLGLELISR